MVQAVLCGHNGIVELLLAHGARDTGREDANLALAAGAGQIETVKHLLEGERAATSPHTSYPSYRSR